MGLIAVAVITDSCYRCSCTVMGTADTAGSWADYSSSFTFWPLTQVLERRRASTLSSSRVVQGAMRFSMCAYAHVLALAGCKQREV